MFSIPELRLVEEVMDKEFLTVSKEITLEEATKMMMISNQRYLIISDEKNKIDGIVSMTDIHNVYKENYHYESIRIEDIMIKNIITINKKDTIYDARDKMLNEKIGVLPVIENNKVVGILNQSHIRDYLYMQLEDYGMTIRYIVGEIKEGICAMDKDGNVILWNKFMEDRYDINARDITGKKMSDFLENTVSERVLKTRTKMSDVYYTERKEAMYGLVHSNPVFLGDEFMGVVCTEVDITEAKRLSMELEKANDTLKYLENQVKELSKGNFDNIVGRSYKLEKSKGIAKQVAKTTSSILILGESGTGKEVFSRAIHDYSERKGQFVPVNCSAIPAELFESEFFGYESGAFTGASKKGKIGIFELAKDGTVFLDEIGDMPLSMQAKLLRVLQEKEVRRIGGEKIININSRIISATNKDLKELVRQGKFREDLYYRLNVVEIELPTLRERKEDIEVLIHNFLKEICEHNNLPVLSITKRALKMLQRYSWKGNIRELKNTIENIVVLSNGKIIDIDDLPEYIIRKSNEKEFEEDGLDLVKVTEKIERRTIMKALSMAKGNKSKASKILNIPRTTLYYKISQYEINDL